MHICRAEWINTRYEATLLEIATDAPFHGLINTEFVVFSDDFAAVVSLSHSTLSLYTIYITRFILCKTLIS